LQRSLLAVPSMASVAVVAVGGGIVWWCRGGRVSASRQLATVGAEGKLSEWVVTSFLCVLAASRNSDSST